MPKIALADTLQEWQSILAGLGENPALDTPALRELRERLRLMIGAAQELVAEKNSLQARRQAVTQQLRMTRDQGDDLIIKVRGSIRSVLGHSNEALVRFGIRPTRRRPRKTKVVAAAIPRPDLLPAAGIQVMGPEAGASSEEG
ncbi:MAG TPA: hypothetical protein VFR03_11765 [Thermoanaerobaculia bacterium]|nr:hypothetical protein [Thermoanaerobaculia bacterium]